MVVIQIVEATVLSRSMLGCGHSLWQLNLVKATIHFVFGLEDPSHFFFGGLGTIVKCHFVLWSPFPRRWLDI